MTRGWLKEQPTKIVMSGMVYCIGFYHMIVSFQIYMAKNRVSPEQLPLKDDSPVLKKGTHTPMIFAALDSPMILPKNCRQILTFP
jgi:hypothetical protein